MAFPKRRESEKAVARWPGDLIENQRKEWVPTTDKHKALHQAAALNGAEGGGTSVLSVPERHARTAVFLRKGWGWGKRTSVGAKREGKAGSISLKSA